MLTLPTVATTHMSNAIVYIVFFNVLKIILAIIVSYIVHNVMFLHNVSYLIKPLHFKLNSFVLQIPTNCL